MAAATLDELCSRAEALIPSLRQRAPKAESLRRVPDETIQDFKDAGFFRVFVPNRYGGLELDYGPTQIELSSRLGRGCGSSAWVQCVVAVHAWILAMLPEPAQEAVWSSGPDTLMTTAISPMDGTIQRVEGGYLLDGQWQFSSGIDAAEWVLFSGPILGEPNSRAPWLLVHKRDWEIVDTWYAAGLKGTGSKDVRVRQVFVPDEWVARGADRPGTALNTAYIYRLPFGPLFFYNVACPALGVALGAIDAYIAAMSERPERARMPQRQMHVAESAAEVDAALALLRADSAQIVALGQGGADIPVATQTRWSRNTAFAVRLCARAVDRLGLAIGAHGVLENTPLQRAVRDMHAIANHAGNSWDLRGEAYGRVAFGLEVGPPF
jgi:3-hydroxy-9,10-secoandrosta-1,3,5(10)-triene-9,17-dione monooxygenase